MNGSDVGRSRWSVTRDKPPSLTLTRAPVFGSARSTSVQQIQTSFESAGVSAQGAPVAASTVMRFAVSVPLNCREKLPFTSY